MDTQIDAIKVGDLLKYRDSELIRCSGETVKVLFVGKDMIFVSNNEDPKASLVYGKHQINETFEIL